MCFEICLGPPTPPRPSPLPLPRTFHGSRLFPISCGFKNANHSCRRRKAFPGCHRAVLIRPTQPGLQDTEIPRAPAAATQKMAASECEYKLGCEVSYPHPPSASEMPAACNDATVWSWCFFGSFQLFMGFLKARWWPYWVCRKYGRHMLSHP